jgi:uncharacterized protein (DUF885 family)
MQLNKRRTALAVTCVGCILMVALLSCSKPKPMNNLGNLKREYLDGLFLAKPHLATFMGDHRFDDRLPDLSPRGLELRQRVLEQQRLRLDSIDKSKLPLDEQVDVEILSDGIDLELLYLREIKDWEWDPRIYDSFPYYDPREILASRISDIIHGDFAPAGDRLRSLVSQLQELPEFLRQAKSRLANPSPIYTSQAIDSNKGRIALFEGELAAFIKSAEGVDESLRRRAEENRIKAVAALQEYQHFLETDLLARSHGDWRLGADRYRKKFPLALQTSRTPEETVTRAEAAFKKARQELHDLAVQLQRELFPVKARTNETNPRIQGELIREVKDELSKDHPAAAELVDAHRRNLDDFRSFIEQHNLLQLPPRETLVVKEMPDFKRGVAAAEYLAPGVLEGKSQWQGTYYVDPVDPTWSPDRVESYLRGNNNYEVQLTAMHEAYPGHHTQFFYSRQNLNPLRAVLWNAPMVEGWAVYVEDLMVREGYGGNKNPGYRFFAKRGDMIVATNTIIDIKLHSGLMSEQEAVRFMVEEGFQEKAQAEKKLLRAQLDTTQLCQYFLGYDEIQDLERDYRAAVKERFNQRELDEALIQHGSIAVKYLRKYLLR